VSDAWRNRERRSAKNRHYANVFGSVLEDHHAPFQRGWQGRIHGNVGRRLIHAQRDDARGGRTTGRRTCTLRPSTRVQCDRGCGEQSGPCSEGRELCLQVGDRLALKSGGTGFAAGTARCCASAHRPQQSVARPVACRRPWRLKTPGTRLRAIAPPTLRGDIGPISPSRAAGAISR
jgi:hypothetical protein